MRRNSTFRERACAHCGAVKVMRGQTCSRACAAQYRTRPLADRFWGKVDISPGPLACWLFTATPQPSGYGRIGAGGKYGADLYAHRAAWWLATGHWPMPDEDVCHTCDVKLCVRNDEVGTYIINDVVYPRRGHLFLAPAAANTADMINKGRHGAWLRPENRPRGSRHGAHTHPEEWKRGETNSQAKLTASAVVEIRTRYANGGATLGRLGTEYGVSKQVIADVVHRRTWKHVD